jgi:predicted esterase
MAKPSPGGYRAAMRISTGAASLLLLLTLWSASAAAVPGELTANPRGAPPATTALAPGFHRVAGGGHVYVPRSATGHPAPVLVLLTGTGGRGDAMVRSFTEAADRDGIVLLAITPRRENWDSVENFFDTYERGSAAGRTVWPRPQFGDDAHRLDLALADLFTRVPVAPNRIGILGFSHGASYALTLGTANSRLFSAIMALSPGILVLPAAPAGGQRVYVAHGSRDSVQPFRRTRESFVPRLVALGFQVTFRPFDDGHVLPSAVVAEALRFFLTGSVAQPPVEAGR